MQRSTNKNFFSFAIFSIALTLAASFSDAVQPAGRQMVINKVPELGLEIWTEVEPKWEVRLNKTQGMAPVFTAETPANTYPPAGMTWASPGEIFSDEEFPTAAQGAVYQAALNYGLSDAQAKALSLKKASYGELTGYESEFSANAGDTPVDVKVFFGHRAGKPAVAMQVFTLKDKLPHIAENIRRSWVNVRYLQK